jgi:alpha-galactosidase
MKIVIIGAGSIAFTPALLAGFAGDLHYRKAIIALVDINPQVLSLVERFARRVSDELGLDWTIEASTDRRDVLSAADVVTAAVGVGGLDAWVQDVDIPLKYEYIQPVGDTSGPGGLARALRHIPVLVDIGKDMEQLCPGAVLYNFTNPLTVLTQAVNQLTRTRCIGLCIGPDLTWNYLCRLIGADRSHTRAIIGGINHCHWILDLRIEGQDAIPVLSAALDELDGKPQGMEYFRRLFAGVITQPAEPQEREVLCSALFRQLGYYPGPGDGHVVEFFPQFIKSTIVHPDSFQGGAIRHVHATYPELGKKMEEIALGKIPIETDTFARELAWEHTQLLDILVSQFDNLGQVYYVNLPNQGYIHNLPDGMVVEIPATVDASGIHPYALGDFPSSILPYVLHKLTNLELIIEGAMEGSRRKAIQALINDPYTTDMARAEQVVNELVDAEINYLPHFQ